MKGISPFGALLSNLRKKSPRTSSFFILLLRRRKVLRLVRYQTAGRFRLAMKAEEARKKMY
jgi:hypothetical protein